MHHRRAHVVRRMCPVGGVEVLVAHRGAELLGLRGNYVIGCVNRLHDRSRFPSTWLHLRKEHHEAHHHWARRSGAICLPQRRAIHADRDVTEGRLVRGLGHLLNRCGHWAQLEHAVEFNRLVSGFVAEAS